MFDYYLFDLDGTLTDPGLGITNAVMYALSKYGISVNDREQLYKFIGPPLLDSFHEYYGFDDEQCAEALAYYREYYSVTGLLENEVYDGIIDLLKQLKAAGKTIILATSKPEEYSVRILEHFNLLEYFDDVSGATMDEKRSKKDEIITYALRKNNIVDTNKCVMIGDRKYDILGGKKNHLKTMGVLYGYGSHEELTAAGADYLVSSPAEIFKI